MLSNTSLSSLVTPAEVTNTPVAVSPPTKATSKQQTLRAQLARMNQPINPSTWPKPVTPIPLTHPPLPFPQHHGDK